MTEQQVIERLAGRLDRRHLSIVYSDFLTSRDALAPVLEGLSEGEWYRLVKHLAATNLSLRCVSKQHSFPTLLTMPPRDLAFAIAEALEEKQ
jgi:hypothetical protein